MLIHWIWFAQLQGMSQRQKMNLLRQGAEPEDLYHAQSAELTGMEGMTEEGVKALSQKDLQEARRIGESCRQNGIGIVTFRDAAYPDRLRNVSDGPVLLYYRGTFPDLEEQPVIALVGTRKATPYGIQTTRSLAAQLAVCGGLVISGGASGVDTAAMEAALEAGCTTVGVLGCGVDVVYPVSNRKLFAEVAKKGCLISEYPPGDRPEPWHFPQRNRILSGISHGVLVVEAPRKSGALITARCALEQGRDVFAVPGNIDSAACEGSNELLLEGAQPVMTGWQLLQSYSPLFPDTVARRELPAGGEKKTENSEPDKKAIDNPADRPYDCMMDRLKKLGSEEQALMAHLSAEPILLDELIAKCQLPAAKVLRMTTLLSMEGLVIMHPGRRISAKTE